MQKILVANRGEIALRIMKTCRKMGIATVAVYSEADKNAPHVAYADEAVCLGAAPSAQSYLSIEKILRAAADFQVDAIHPGYGFLSENPTFAQKVTDAGICFIGPSPQAMEVMGSKLGAKAAVKAYSVPLVPGTDEAISDLDVARRVAAEIGFPVLIKASAGGGGKGMRVVEDAAAFDENLQRAVSEAENAFGDGAVFIEKYLGQAKHIEIQILADQHGKVLHLFERECSVQRRHQKVIEEAPSSVLSPALRQAMGKSAVEVAKACGYLGAGTVEFIYQNEAYFFLEMNTRLQVEHPVTEMITGLDLVEWQIRIARGEALPMEQEELRIDGHALEVRVYAEDPANNFLPDIGRLRRYREPLGPHIRVDSGFLEGMDVPIFYDPMLAKLIVHGKDRHSAIEAMKEAIGQFEILGVATTLEFCLFVLQHPAFLNGDFTTRFVEEHFSPEKMRQLVSETDQALAAALGAFLVYQKDEAGGQKPISEPLRPWNLKR